MCEDKIRNPRRNKFLLNTDLLKSILLEGNGKSFFILTQAGPFRVAPKLRGSGQNPTVSERSCNRSKAFISPGVSKVQLKQQWEEWAVFCNAQYRDKIIFNLKIPGHEGTYTGQ